MRKYVVIRTQFEATHSWPECPFSEVNFLRNEHRHIFHVEVKLEVLHNDRGIEFIVMKRSINDFLGTLGIRLGRMSCEDIAERIINAFSTQPILSVSVFEDNENGAVVEI